MRGAVGMKSISPVRAIPRLDDLVRLLGVLRDFLDSEAPARLAEIAEKTEAANSLIAQANEIAERERLVAVREERVEAKAVALQARLAGVNSMLSEI